MDKMVCTADCGCCCTACKNGDHRNCSHARECPEKQKAGIYDTNQARQNAAQSAKDVQSLPMTPAAAQAANALTAPGADFDPWLNPGGGTQATSPPAPPSAVPVVAVMPLEQVAPPLGEPILAPRLEAKPAQPLGNIFASPEAQAVARVERTSQQEQADAAWAKASPQTAPRAAARAISEASPPDPGPVSLDPAWRIASDLATLEATLSFFEDEVSTKTPGPGRNKVLLELAQALAAVREVGMKAHDLAKMLERVRVAANALEASP
jgi:hypothetical protein